MSNVVEEFIQHYGVKGMHWGVRKARGDRSVFKEMATRKLTGGRRTIYGKPARNLTDAELQRRIKRMETEKRYEDLNKRTVGKGEAMATEIITNVGKTVITTLATNATLLGVRGFLGQRISSKSAEKLGMETAKEVAAQLTKRGKK